MSEWTSLVQAEVLAERLRDATDHSAPKIFDCRTVLGDPDAGEAAWRAGHLPGALHANLERDLSGPHMPGAGRHPWPDDAAFAAWLGRCGVAADTQVVAYDGGDGAYAARLWFLLRNFGHRRVAVLDGGWARWTTLGLPVETSAHALAPALHPGHFDRARLLDASAVPSALAHGALLIDARAAERYRGEVEPIDRVAGHVPGAVNRPYAANLHEGRFKPAQTLAAEFAALLGAHSAETAVVMCGSGVTACHHLLAMEYAGLPMAKLFTGSWSGWIEDPARPVAVGAS